MRTQGRKEMPEEEEEEAGEGAPRRRRARSASRGSARPDLRGGGGGRGGAEEEASEVYVEDSSRGAGDLRGGEGGRGGADPRVLERMEGERGARGLSRPRGTTFSGRQDESGRENVAPKRMSTL